MDAARRSACVIFVGIVTVEAAGRELRHKRVHERRLTQEQLASRLGISGRELNDIECEYAGAREGAIARGAVSRQLSLFASDIALPLRLGSRLQIWQCGTPGKSADRAPATDCRSRQALPGRGDMKVGHGTGVHAERRYAGGRRTSPK